MTNMSKRYTRFINIHKMSNACVSSFCRYIKWLNEWYTMYVKNSNFLFKSMFLRKNGRTEKNWNSFAAAPSEKQAPPYWSDSLQNFNNCSAIYFKKDLNGYMHSSSDAHHLIKKKSTPSKISHFPSTGGEVLPHPLTLFGKPWSVRYPGFFLAYC